MIQNDLRQLGETFRKKREEVGLSLKEAENATSIRMAHLNAIEEGDMTKLISPIYAQGFVRQYAQFLELDADGIIRDHPEIFDTRREKQEFSYGIGTLESRGSPGTGVGSMPNLLRVAAIGGVLALAWAFARFLQVV